MHRHGIAFAAAFFLLTWQTALADGVRKYTPADLYVGSGNPQTSLVRLDNPIPGSDVQINCPYTSCEVVVSFTNSYCNSYTVRSFASKVYVDGNRLVLAAWLIPGNPYGAACGSGIWAGNFELHSGSHTVSLDTYINWDTDKYPTTQGPWQVSYQIGIPNP